MLDIKKILTKVLTAINDNVWTYAGSASSSGTVTVPNTATEVWVYVFDTNNSSKFFASGTARIASITGRAVWDLGGYYYSSSDYGIYNLNVSNSGKTFGIRNIIRGGNNIKSNCSLSVYYKTI